MGDEGTCRICGDDGQYDIFESDMKFESKSMKIYMILNNFGNEKLYGPDEYSSMMCAICCDSMHSSYSFMLKVRDAEKTLRAEGYLPRRKKLKFDAPSKPVIEQPMIIDEVPSNENIFEENVFEDEFVQEEEEEVQQTLIETRITPAPPSPVEQRVVPVTKLPSPLPPRPSPTTLQPRKEAPAKKRPKTPVQLSNEEKSIIISHYRLEEKEESDHKTILFESKILDRANENDGFEEYYALINQQQDNSIFSCKYCVKAFANSELLIKHITSSHVCLFCFSTSPSYKELSAHAKSHANQKFRCPLCLKIFSQSLYRQHIKKNHFLHIPFFVTIKPEMSNNCH